MSRIDEIREICNEGRPVRRIDIKYLLEQITALQEENDRLKAMNEKLLTDGNEMVKKLTVQNAAIKKALDKVCNKIESWDDSRNFEQWKEWALQQARSANSKEGEKK